MGDFEERGYGQCMGSDSFLTLFLQCAILARAWRPARGRVSMAKRKEEPETSSATLGFEPQLWAAANALRGSMDAAEYKHVVLGLIFLKYISDAFEEHRKKLLAEPYADPEDPDEYRAENIFWVPPGARWSELQKNARQPNIGELVDRAMEAVERDNPSLKGVLPKDYASGARQDPPRPAHRPDLQHSPRRRREPRPGHPRPGVRVLPRAVRECRGKEGRGVLHAALHRQAPCGNAPPIQGAGLRPLLRLGRHVCPIRGVHRSPRRAYW